MGIPLPARVSVGRGVDPGTYQVKTDKASGIVNDPNDWSRQVGDPRYVIDLLAAIEQAHAALAADGPDADARVAALEAAVARVSVTTEGSRRG